MLCNNCPPPKPSGLKQPPVILMDPQGRQGSCFVLWVCTPGLQLMSLYSKERRAGQGMFFSGQWQSHKGASRSTRGLLKANFIIGTQSHPHSIGQSKSCDMTSSNQGGGERILGHWEGLQSHTEKCVGIGRGAAVPQLCFNFLLFSTTETTMPTLLGLWTVTTIKWVNRFESVWVPGTEKAPNRY